MFEVCVMQGKNRNRVEKKAGDRRWGKLTGGWKRRRDVPYHPASDVKPLGLLVCWARICQFHMLLKCQKRWKGWRQRQNDNFFSSLLQQEGYFTSIVFNTSAVLVSEVSLPVLFTFLDLGPIEVKPLLTHFY